MIRVFLRHCMYSSASRDKERPINFDRQKLFLQVLDSLPPSIPVTVFLDKKEGDRHFTESSRAFIHSEHCGSEAKSFTQLIQYILKQNFSSQDILVILEDDYKVLPNWHLLIEEGLGFGDYVSLYDHPDKYTPLYDKLQSLLFKGERHWRTTPSTTNSYAMRMKTLAEDVHIHLEYSANVNVTRDHEKFLALWQEKKTLVSCIPSAWSHEELGMQTLEHSPKEASEPQMTYFS